MLRFPLATLLLALPAQAQRVAEGCRADAVMRSAGAAMRVGVRPGVADVRGPAPRAATRPCPDARRAVGAKTEARHDTWTGADWVPLSRTRTERTDADSLALFASDVWDGAAWQPDVLDTYAYGAGERLAEHARRYWVGPEMIYDYRETFAYDAAGRVSEYVFQVGTATGYENNGRALPAYDAAGRVSSVLSELWTGAAWEPYTVQGYVYDSAGRPTEETRADWDGAAFVPADRQTKAYDDATGALVVWTFESWDGTAWVPTGRDRFTVDAAGRTTERIGESAETGVFVPFLRDRITYLAADGPEVATAESRTWDGAAWGQGFAETLTYDAARRLATYTYAVFDGAEAVPTGLFRQLYTRDTAGRTAEFVEQVAEGAAWTNVQQILYGVGADGRPDVELSNRWDGAAWQRDTRTVFSYTAATAGEPGAGAGVLALAVGPNPARGAVRVSFSLAEAGDARADVFDGRGRLVARLLGGALPAGTHGAVWDARGLAAGVYTVRVAAGGQVAAQTVTLVR